MEGAFDPLESAAQENRERLREIQEEVDDFYGPDSWDEIVEEFEALSDDEYEALAHKLVPRHRFATPQQRRLAYEATGGHCYYCRVEVRPDKFHADHIVPYSHGGTTSNSNIVCSCRPCNLAKSTMSYGDFIRELQEKGLEWRDERFRMQLAYFRQLEAERMGDI